MLSLIADRNAAASRVAESPTTESLADADRSGRGAGRGARVAGRRADSMAVASFVLGLVGLLVLNVVLGPLAVALACLALRGGTARRGRALLGLGLGVTDLVVLAALATTNGTVSWNFS